MGRASHGMALRAGARNRVAEQSHIPGKKLVMAVVHLIACSLPAALSSLDLETWMVGGVYSNEGEKDSGMKDAQCRSTGAYFQKVLRKSKRNK